MLTRRVAEVEITLSVAEYVVDHDLEAGDKDSPNIDGQEKKRKFAVFKIIFGCIY